MKAGRLAALLLLAAVSAVTANSQGLGDWRAMEDSLSGVHPRLRGRWLREHGFDDSYYTTFHKPESTGLVCIGRWPWGPSWELAGRDSLLFLGSGSGVRILSIADSVHPRMLGQINARGLVSQLGVRDSLLFVACGNWGAQIYGVSNPAAPRELGSMDAVIGDVAVKDTICYALGGDSLRIYNVANPGLPTRLSALRDSGEVLAVANNHAFTGNQFVMNVIDVSDPAQPRWVNSRGGDYLSLSCRRNLLFQGSYDPDNFVILDVSNPLAITEVSRLTGLSTNGMHIQGDYAYLAWGGFHVVSIADSAHPVLRGSSYHYDDEREPFVHAPGTYAYLACRYGGLKVIDVHQDTAPRETTTCFVAGSAQDIGVQDTVAFVTSRLAGVNTVGLTQVAVPHDLGWLGPLSGTQQVTYGCALKDSFAFVGWQPNPYFRTLSLTDPANPVYAGGCTAFEFAQDMVLKDSFAHCAENYKFQVVNVARPRSPTVVGTCNLPERSRNLCVRDTFAYVAQGYTGLIILSVAQPSAPRELGRYMSVRSTHGIWVEDTLAYIAEFDSGLTVISVARPQSCYKIGSRQTPGWAYDILVQGGVAYVSCRDGIRAFDVRNPRTPREVGFQPTPYYAWRLVYGAPYLYVACADAGVGIYETCSVGVAEAETPAPRARLLVRPSPARGHLLVETDRGVRVSAVRVSDATGRIVLLTKGGQPENTAEVNVRELPAGLYFVEVVADGGSSVKGKFVKQ